MNMATAPALGFHKCGSDSGVLFFHRSRSCSGFCSFSHVNTLRAGICYIHTSISA